MLVRILPSATGMLSHLASTNHIFTVPRDIQGYSKQDPSLQPLRLYTGHSAYVAVSIAKAWENIHLISRRMLSGTPKTRTCLVPSVTTARL